MRALAVAMLLLLAPLATWIALACTPANGQPAQQSLRRPGDHFAGAQSCVTCHPQQHASWDRTHHSRMTQMPTATSVLGAFDGRPVEYEGRRARPFAADGRFFMEVPEQSGTRTAEVALCVGSRRYQQYFEKIARGDGFVMLRLPILWHVGARRWLHLNTVFLGPDDPDWDVHRSSWNDNCIFCHNTGPQPGLLNTAERPTGERRSYDSKVADLGIACESCHGPGEDHEGALRAPLARYAAHFHGSAPAIVHPGKLDQARATSVCGQCHGQRLPEPIARAQQWIKSGPTFRSGENLTDHVKPLAIDTPVPGKPDSEEYSLRFWKDGTARLTAYEYQGTVASPCYRGGKMTCESCHAMHQGDVNGMLLPRMRGDDACTQCHAAIAADVTKHTHHQPGSSGSSCLDCHMPRIVYGIIEIHRSHRIEVPDPARDAANGRPNACTLCHLDQSPPWAAAAMRKWWGDKYKIPERRDDRAPLDLPDAVASLLCGDAVQRAVYAQAFGRGSALAPTDKALLRGVLAFTLGDAYPSVRWLAQKSLQALERELPTDLCARVDAFDHMAPRETRRAQALALLDELPRALRPRLHAPRPGMLMSPEFRMDLPALIRLVALQDARAIAIGE